MRSGTERLDEAGGIRFKNRMNRTDDGLIIECWTDVAQHLAGGRDLTEWARSCGAFERSRRIGDGETLLRLALAYGCCGLSLRQAALWAAGDGIATLSDEALYKRLAKTGAWLGEIATGLLGGRTGGDKRRLRVVDGTTVTAPGSDRPNWRLILDFDPDAQRLCGLSLSPAKQGESLGRCSLDPGDLAIADRGFARPDGLAAIRGKGRISSSVLASGRCACTTPSRTGSPSINCCPPWVLKGSINRSSSVALALPRCKPGSLPSLCPSRQPREIGVSCNGLVSRKVTHPAKRRVSPPAILSC